MQEGDVAKTKTIEEWLTTVWKWIQAVNHYWAPESPCVSACVDTLGRGMATVFF